MDSTEEMIEHTKLLLLAGHVHDGNGCDLCAQILALPLDAQLLIVQAAADRRRRG